MARRLDADRPAARGWAARRRSRPPGAGDHRRFDPPLAGAERRGRSGPPRRRRGADGDRRHAQKDAEAAAGLRADSRRPLVLDLLPVVRLGAGDDPEEHREPAGELGGAAGSPPVRELPRSVAWSSGSSFLLGTLATAGRRRGMARPGEMVAFLQDLRLSCRSCAPMPFTRAGPGCSRPSPSSRRSACPRTKRCARRPAGAGAAAGRGTGAGRGGAWMPCDPWEKLPARDPARRADARRPECARRYGSGAHERAERAPRGARAGGQGLHWAVTLSRRSCSIPSFAYLLVLMHVASVTRRSPRSRPSASDGDADEARWTRSCKNREGAMWKYINLSRVRRSSRGRKGRH